MKYGPLSLHAALSCALLASLSGCATLPPCAGSLLPIVEVQINDTASNHDDYGSTGSPTVGRARITNVNKFGGGLNFPGGVAVEIRVPNGLPSLVYSATAAGATSPSLFQTLPADGSWSNFFITGTTSTAEKGAIVEVATSGTCDEVVIARKSMMIPSGAPPIASTAGQPRVDIEIGSVATLDDYLAWSPISGRIRWANGAAPATLGVTLRNMAGADHLRFAAGTLAGGDTATLSTLPLTLNGDGSWVRFYVAGNFASPSIVDKDAILEVVDSASTLLSRDGLMVRIRKNANGLQDVERDRYLAALQKISATYGDYIEFVRTHSRSSGGATLVSHRQAHSGSGFLPWHRAFVLDLERLLQAADPSVALHYWKFDSSAPNVFDPDFMGSNDSAGGNFATLATTNPIVAWTLPGESVPTGIQRETPYGDAGNPAVANDTSVLALGGAGFNYSGFKTMESSAHNPAHSRSGFTNSMGAPLTGASWVGGSPAIAPRDPLFFFLHSNVDRLWARWQWLHDRTAPTVISSYDLQGSHDAPAAGVAAPLFTQDPVTNVITANRTLGQYADDSMWPWDNVTGGVGTKERPDIAIITPFPVVLQNILPLGRPSVGLMIDYASITATTPLSGMGYGYDDTNPFD